MEAGWATLGKSSSLSSSQALVPTVVVAKPMEGLRSFVWSSETLQEGMSSVSKQPATLFAKTEEDLELQKELQVSR